MLNTWLKVVPSSESHDRQGSVQFHGPISFGSATFSHFLSLKNKISSQISRTFQPNVELETEDFSNRKLVRQSLEKNKNKVLPEGVG